MTTCTGAPAEGHDRTEPVDIQVEMQRSYIDYAMSVIVGRALPDVRDGLKPVHRRILYAMYDGGYRPDRGYFKCAPRHRRRDGQLPPARRHRHLRRPGAAGPALVAADTRWSTLRATSARPVTTRPPPTATPSAGCAPLAMEMLRDIDKETVDFRPNYDGRSAEPVVLPAAVPEPAGQRLRGHRGRHGDQDPAAQPARGGRRRRSGPWTTPTPPTRSCSRR